MNKKLFIFVLSIFLITNALALGITPGRTTIDFEPGMQKPVSFDILNSEGKDMEVVFAVDGELAEYISFKTNKVKILASEPQKTFTYDLNLPTNLEPGTRSGRILAIQVFEDSGNLESSVGATLGVATQVHVNVPYPGKFASADMIIYNSAAGEETTFVFPVISKGEFDLTAVRANVDIYNKVNEKVGSFNTKSISIPSGERKEIVYSYDSGLAIGEYRAVATLIYDDGTINLEETFTVGSKELELQEINVNNFNLGEIAKLEMLVENKWSEDLNDVYIETSIMDDDGSVVSNFKSSDYNVGALEKEVFVSYWDTAGVSEGIYKADVSIHYGGKTSDNSLQFDVSQNDLTVIGLGYVVSNGGDVESNGLMILLIVVIAVLVIINLLWFLVFRKKLEEKK